MNKKTTKTPPTDEVAISSALNALADAIETIGAVVNSKSADDSSKNTNQDNI